MLENKSASLRTYLQESRIAKIIEIVLVMGIPPILFSGILLAGVEQLFYKTAFLLLFNLIAILLVFWGLKIRGNTLRDFGFDIHRKGRKYWLNTFLLSLLIFVLAMGGFLIGSVIAQNLVSTQPADLDTLSFLSGNPLYLIGSLISTYFFASFGEELIYRAFLITRIEEIGSSKRVATVIGVIISTLFFALAHFQWGPVGIIQTAGMGLMLGLSYVFFKRNLMANVLAHGYMDTLLLVSVYLQ